MKIYVSKNPVYAAVTEPIIYNKKLTILAGMNGVGKSTLANVLRINTDSLGYIIDPDDYAVRYGGNISGGKEALKDIDYCISNGIEFTEETTLSGNTIFKTMRRAKISGYEVHLIYIGVDSPDESISRVQNRVKHGGHDIDSNLIRQRYEKRWDNLYKALHICNTADFYDNNAGYKLIATYKDRHISAKCNEYPQWMDDFIDYLDSKE